MTLASMPLDDAQKKLASCPGDVAGKAGFPFPPFNGESPEVCAQLPTLRNCIYAVEGKSFDSDKWQQLFSAKSWYRTNPQFVAANMPDVATANIKTIKAAEATCKVKNDERQITKENRAFIDSWLAGIKSQKLPVTKATFYVEGKAVAMKTYLDTVGAQRMPDPAVYSVFPCNWDSELAALAASHCVSVGAKVGACSDEECEGSPFAQFGFKGNDVVGISFPVQSACPFVYHVDANGEHMVGEIIANLSHPDFEGTQRLRMPAVAQCDGERIVVIRELKPETSFIDDLSFAVNGIQITPEECSHAPSLCGNDGMYVTLTQGQSLTLRFRGEAACQAGELVSNGYYLRDPRN